MPVIAPWLKAPNLAEDWLQGVALGQRATEAQQRLQEERNRVALESQIHAQTLQQRAVEDQQRLAVTKAYHEQEIGLAQQRLQEVQQQNAAKVQDAAMKLQRQTQFNKIYRDTGDVQQALFASGLGTPSNIMAARKDALDLGSDRLKLSQERLQMQEAAAKAKADKGVAPRRIGEKVVTDPTSGDRTTSYIFDQPGVGTAPAKQVKRLRWDSTKNALIPVEASAPATVPADDEEQ